jgi:iron complex outermembrane recepter protein
MKYPPAACLAILAGSSLVAGQAMAEDPVLSPVEVTASVPAAVAPDTERGFTASTVAAQGVSTFGGPAQTNPYRAIDLLPSVNLSGTDAYGLTVDQNFLRIRGISAYTYSNLAMTVNGIPSTINVGNGGMGNLWDLENVEAVSLIRGAIPADKGLGFGDLAGAMDLTLKAPAREFSATERAAYGSENFHKLFARIDSGEFGTGTRFFLSGSEASTDKWRGPGDQNRRNISAGIAQRLGDDGNLEIYAVQNSFARDEYRSLTYAQSQNLGTYNNLDFNARKTGVAAQDALYYDYNRQQFDENNVFAKLSWKFGDDTEVRLKPYWSKTEGYRYAYSGSNIVRMDINQEQSGLVAEILTKLAGQSLTAGWWTQRIETIPPPLGQKVYTINSSGNLVFKNWGILADMGQRDYESPYLNLSGGTGPFKYTAGLRYLHFTLPGITTYTSTGIGDISRDAALALNPAVNKSLTTSEASYNALLPSLALQWAFSPTLDGRLSAGRNVGNPWLGPLYSTYMSNVTRFQTAGVSLQNLWNSLRLEKADTVDLGLSWHGERLTLAPTLYYTRFKDKQVTAYDAAVGVSYLQSGVDAHAYGAELEAVWAASSNLNLIGSLSWNIDKLDDNIVSAAGTSIASKGKQVPDTPQWLAKLGATYRLGAWSLSPMIRYVGERYGDALNTEKVSAYTLADVHSSYRFGRQGGFAWLEVDASVLNLFDKQYISTINAGQDDARPGATTYYPGAPRTWMVSLSGGF